MQHDPGLEDRVEMGLEKARKLFGTDDRLALTTCLYVILAPEPDQPPRKGFFEHIAGLEPFLAQGFSSLEQQIRQTFAVQPAPID